MLRSLPLRRFFIHSPLELTPPPPNVRSEATSSHPEEYENHPLPCWPLPARSRLTQPYSKECPPVSEPEREDPSESEEGTMERGGTMLVTKPFRSLRQQSPREQSPREQSPCEHRAPGGVSA